MYLPVNPSLGPAIIDGPVLKTPLKSLMLPASFLYQAHVQGAFPPFPHVLLVHFPFDNPNNFEFELESPTTVEPTTHIGHPMPPIANATVPPVTQQQHPNLPGVAQWIFCVRGFKIM